MKTNPSLFFIQGAFAQAEQLSPDAKCWVAIFMGTPTTKRWPKGGLIPPLWKTPPIRGIRGRGSQPFPPALRSILVSSFWLRGKTGFWCLVDPPFPEQPSLCPLSMVMRVQWGRRGPLEGERFSRVFFVERFLKGVFILGVMLNMLFFKEAL